MRALCVFHPRYRGTPPLLAMGQGGGQQRHTRAVSSEKWWDSVAAYGAGMRVIAAFFGPYASDALPSHVSVFSHDFKRFERLTKLATSSYSRFIVKARIGALRE